MRVTADTELNRQEQLVITAELAEIEPLPIPYRKRAATWRPNYAVILWTRVATGNGDWGPWTLGGHVSGPEVKNDGADSQRRHSMRLYGERTGAREVPAGIWEWIIGTKPAGGSDAPA